MTDHDGTFRVQIETKGADLKNVVRGVKDLLQVAAKRLGHGQHLTVELDDEQHGTLVIQSTLPLGQVDDLIDKARAKIATSRGWNIKAVVTEVPHPAPAERPVAVPPHRDQEWAERQVEKRTLEIEAAYRLQAQREEAARKTLEQRVTDLAKDKDRLEREKDEAERTRKAVEAQNDTLLQSILSFADDPSKATLQIVSRAANWIRRLENQLKEGGADSTVGSLDEVLAIAKMDLLAYANSVLSPTGKTARSLEELQRLADPTPWEETEYHRTHANDYLKAKEELEFVLGIESGRIRVPESVRDLIVAGLTKPPREEMVESYETSKKDHQTRKEAGTLASAAARKHEYAARIRSLIQNRPENDPIPLAVLYRAELSGGRIEVRVPVGLEGGPVTRYLLGMVSEAATSAGFRMTTQPETGKEPTIVLEPAENQIDRAALLGMQGKFREELVQRLDKSHLKEAGVTFRMLDVRDFVV